MASSNLLPFKINLIFDQWKDNKLVRIVEPFTYFDGSTSSRFGSYDEELELKENAQVSLTFKVVKNIDGKLNPYIKYLVNNRELQFIYGEEYYYLIITDITPQFYKETIVYTVTCQDIFSYYLTRNNVNANYVDDEDAITLRYTGKNIQELAKNVMEDSGLKDWIIDSTLETAEYKTFYVSWWGENEIRESIKATLDLTGSNTYNALVEIANLFDAELVVKYPKNIAVTNKIITFRKKSEPHKTYLTLSPNCNLNNLNVSKVSEDFCSILHIEGGEKSDGNIVSLNQPVPNNLKAAIETEIRNNTEIENFKIINDLYPVNYTRDTQEPEGVRYFSNIYTSSIDEDAKAYKQMLKQLPCLNSMLVDFSYFTKNYLMPKQAENDLMRLLTEDYFNSNLLIQLYSEHYYNILREYESTLDMEEELVMQLTQASKAIANLHITGQKDDRISIPVNAYFSNFLTSESDEQQTATTYLDPASSLISTTKEEEYNSVIWNVVNEITALWGSTEEYNYMRGQFNYFHTQSNTQSDFIEERIAKYLGLAQEKAEKFIANITEMGNILTNLNITENWRPIIASRGINNSYYYSYPVDENKELLIDKIVSQLTPYVGNFTRFSELYQENKELERYLDLQYTNEENEVCYGLGICSAYCYALENLKQLVAEYDEDNEDNPRTDNAFLTALYTNYIQWRDNNINWLEKYNSALASSKSIWDLIMQKYGKFIIEASFVNDTELDSYGLYSESMAQFQKMREPLYSYSASMVDWKELSTIGLEQIDIGDTIAIEHANLGLMEKQGDTVVTVRCQIPKTGTYRSIWYYNNNSGRTFMQHNKFYVDLNLTFKNGEIIPSNFDYIHYLTNGEQKVRVVNHQVIHDTSKIELRINGINKTLRSPELKLTMSNEFSSEFILHKLLKSIRYY